jgi:O-antigen ligase
VLRSPPWTDRQADVVGVALVVALGAWMALGAGDGTGAGRPAPVLVLLVGLVLAATAGRLLADRGFAVAGPVAGAALATFALTYPGLLQAAGPPTGYANANATLAAVGALAAVAASRLAPPGRARQGWALAAAALAGVTGATGSVAGTAVLGIGAALVMLAAHRRQPTIVPAFGLVLVVFTVGITSAAAAGGLEALRVGDEVRVDLWAGAVEVAREAPLRGHGVGAFEERNPVTDDRDLRWAHHEYLEVALEAGAPALMLVLTLAAWVASRLWSASARQPVLAASAAAAATVVGLHGAVDHVWHRPAPMLLAAALLGAASRPETRTCAPASDDR